MRLSALAAPVMVAFAGNGKMNLGKAAVCRPVGMMRGSLEDWHGAWRDVRGSISIKMSAIFCPSESCSPRRLDDSEQRISGMI